MIAEVYNANRDYERANTWNTPGVVNLTAADHELGIHYRPCPDCVGTGHFPVPWEAREHPPYLLQGKLVPSDFCVACKGVGLQPVMA